MLTHRCVDALDPKATKFALLNPAVAVGVLQRLLEPLARDAVTRGRTADEALGLLKDLLVAGVGGGTPLDACHAVPSPLSDAVGGPLLDGYAVSMGQRLAAAIGAFGFLSASTQVVALLAGSGQDLAGRGNLEPLLDRRLGLQFGHFGLLLVHAHPSGSDESASSRGRACPPRPGLADSRAV